MTELWAAISTEATSAMILAQSETGGNISSEVQRILNSVRILSVLLQVMAVIVILWKMFQILMDILKGNEVSKLAKPIIIIVVAFIVGFAPETLFRILDVAEIVVGGIITSIDQLFGSGADSGST